MEILPPLWTRSGDHMLARLRTLPRPGFIWTALWTTPDLTSDTGRAQDRYRRIALTVGASAAARFTTIVASLITIPLTLHYLGAERYGIWVVISSFNMMLGFADMGLGNGIVNAVAHEHGQDNRERIRAIVSSGYLALLVVAAVLLLGFIIAYPFIPWDRVFNIHTATAIREAGPALSVFIACFAIVIPLSLVQKVQIALQQGFSTGLWQCGGSLLSLMGLLLVVQAGGSLPWLVAALVALPLLATLANSLWFFRGAGRDLLPSIRLASWTVLKVPAKLGLQFFVLQFVASVAYGLDTLIVAQAAGASAVAQFSVPERMFAIIAMLNTILMQPLWPAYREALSRGDRRWIRITLRRSLLVSVSTSTFLAILAIIAGPSAIRLWVGAAVMPSVVLLAGFGIWKIVEAIGNSLAFYLNGTGHLSFQIIIAIICGTMTIALKLIMVHLFGPVGIPWAATIAFIACAIVPSFFYIRKKLS